MANYNNFIRNGILEFEKITNKQDAFLSHDGKDSSEIKDLLKQSYDFAKNTDIRKSNALPELIIQNFDVEQIWQQIELQNEEFLNETVSGVCRLLVGKDDLIFDDLKSEAEVQDSDNLLEDLPPDNSKDSDSEGAVKDEDSAELQVDKPDLESADELSLGSDNSCSDIEDETISKKFKPSEVDDEFFKLDEMNTFLISEEKKLDKPKATSLEKESDSEESVDLFGPEENIPEEEEDEENQKFNNPRFKDYFRMTADQPLKEKRNKFLEENELELESNENNGITDLKSTLELREDRLKKKIKNIEDAALSEKPWQLKGEITAENRPHNSLLGEIVEFDLTTRPAPVITEETTLILEDVIRQRIKDKVFDDVERKQKSVDTPMEYKKKLLLDQEKSKESLAQIYEKEYVQQRDALNPNAAEKEEVDPELHKEIKTMMHSLFSKLDALSNFHFTPRPAAPELKVINNLPAINMEEVAPVATSDAALLAPEEVKVKTKGDIIGKSERTATDKRRERRHKKRKQKIHALEKTKKEKAVEKLRPGLGNKYSKEKATKMLQQVTKEKNVDKMDKSQSNKSVKSSTAFFTQLEQELKSQIKGKSQVKHKKKKGELNAKKMKL